MLPRFRNFFRIQTTGARLACRFCRVFCRGRPAAAALLAATAILRLSFDPKVRIQVA
jgi:hypothetical protein